MARNEVASPHQAAQVEPDDDRPFLEVSIARALRCATRDRGLSRHAVRVLKQIQQLLSGGGLNQALRLIDQLWRSESGDGARLAPVYARLLALDGRDHIATFRLIERAQQLAPDADLAAMLIGTALKLQRIGDAIKQVQTALLNYCVIPGSLLDRTLDRVLRRADLDAVGWVGIGPDLEFAGALRAGAHANSLHVQIDSGAAFEQPIRATASGELLRFHFRTPDSARGSALNMTCHGGALLGSGCRSAPEFSLDGRAELAGNRVHGWVRVGWLPSQPVKLRLIDERGYEHRSRTHTIPQTGSRFPFAVDLSSTRLRGGSIWICAALPDGRWQPLPDAPLLRPRRALTGLGKPARLERWQPVSTRRAAKPARRARQCDVIIPVYRGHDEVLKCLNSVIATKPRSARIVVVEDAGGDGKLCALLEGLALAGTIQLLRNPVNLGFAASVNRALALHPARDAVVLNSDAQVFGDWLARLRSTAYGALRVGTVTPFSNSGSIASYPPQTGSAMDPDEAARLQTLVAASHDGISTEIPVGVGFCLYMRRDCLTEVGTFDADIFGKGYGEESDYCMRARARGWSHRLAADVFVYHAGGSSFGARRAALLDRSQRLLNLRHPGYDRFVADFIARDPIHRLRRQLDERRLETLQARFGLIVTLARAGGVDRFAAERCRVLRARGLQPLVLRPSADGERRRCELWTDCLLLQDLHYQVPSELEALRALLRRLRIENVEIQHFLHLDPRVIDAVRGLGLPYEVFVHDYAWICPRITLIDARGHYCGEPALSQCESCVRRSGSALGEKISVGALRARSETWLRGAQRVVAPSSDTSIRLQRYFPDLQIHVRSNSNLELPPRRLRSPHSGAIRVGLIGAIGSHKGSDMLLKCARDARRRGLPIEFVVIGYTDIDRALLKTGKVSITGRYSEAEVTHLLGRERPDAVWMASVWPETWCYALDYALQAGLPVVAFDLGAIGERLRAANRGVLLPLGLPADQLNDRLLRLAESDLLEDASIEDHHVMNTTTKLEKSMQDEGLSASVQLLPLPPGLYLFSVKTATPSHAPATGALSLPAVHIGLGPGVRPEQVEFMQGVGNHGAWLFAQGDLLIGKVNGTGATLVMTSVRAPGGEVLSIKVERLEDRGDPAQSPAVAADAPKVDEPVKRVAASSCAPTVISVQIPLRIAAHIRSRGDLSFIDTPWAGRVAPGLWIESFSILPTERFQAQDIEYKGLTGSGFETPWLSDNKMCGTRGMSVPLVGFAVRLKPSAEAAAYDCEYSAYFQSGQVVGPLRNGAPCRSTTANDPLEGIQVRILRRPAATRTTEVMPLRAAAATGPSFGRYRDVQEDTRATDGNSPAKSNRRKPGRNTGP